MVICFEVHLFMPNGKFGSGSEQCSSASGAALAWDGFLVLRCIFVQKWICRRLKGVRDVQLSCTPDWTASRASKASKASLAAYVCAEKVGVVVLIGQGGCEVCCAGSQHPDDPRSTTRVPLAGVSVNWCRLSFITRNLVIASETLLKESLSLFLTKIYSDLALP